VFTENRPVVPPGAGSGAGAGAGAEVGVGVAAGPVRLSQVAVPEYGHAAGLSGL
jgi:hypothetical protein